MPSRLRCPRFGPGQQLVGLGMPPVIRSPVLTRATHAGAAPVPRRYGSKLLTTSLAFAATGLYLSSRDSLDASSEQHAPPVEYDPNDPLTRLLPHFLASSRTYLEMETMDGLFKKYVVYLTSSQSYLVDCAPWILDKLEWTRDNVPILGSLCWAIFSFSMGHTFYDVFVGGEDVPRVAPKANILAAGGIGCMLSYSVEAAHDESTKQVGLIWDHLEEAKRAVRQSADLGLSDADAKLLPIKPSVMAIKLTGFTHEPALLARASKSIMGSTSYERGDTLGRRVLFPVSPVLSDEDHKQLLELYDALRGVAEEAKKGGVRLLIDAEQTWLQPAIDRYAELLSAEFNDAPNGPPIIYNTVQAYLKSAPERTKQYLARADNQGWAAGIKLVRGAYVESEAKRAAKEGRENPVWPDKPSTDKCYDSIATLLTTRICDESAKNTARTGAFFATHNGTSCKTVLEVLRAKGLGKNGDGGLLIDDALRGRLAFGQLMGMSDNLTTTLSTTICPFSQHPVKFVYKWVPYASVDHALPYLIRRANENRSIMRADPTSGRGGAKDERKAIGREIRRRLLGV